MEIHIHLDDQHSEKIRQLQQKLNIQLDSLVQQGIDLLYEQQQRTAHSLQILKETGFIGGMEDDADLSENHKEKIDLDDKL